MSEHIPHHLPEVRIEDILAEDVLDAGSKLEYQKRWEKFQADFPDLANEVLKRGYLASEQQLDPQGAMTRLGSYIIAVLERAAQRESSEASSEPNVADDGGVVPQP